MRYSNIFGCALERRTWYRRMGATHQSSPRYYSQIFEAKGHTVQCTALNILSNCQYTEIRAILDSPSTDPSPAEMFTKDLLPKSCHLLIELICPDIRLSYGNGLLKSSLVQQLGLKAV
jgi:hypothetical protein